MEYYRTRTKSITPWYNKVHDRAPYGFFSLVLSKNHDRYDVTLTSKNYNKSTMSNKESWKLINKL